MSRKQYIALRRTLLLLGLVFLPRCLLFAAQDAPAPKVLSFKDFTRRVLSYYPKLKQQDADVQIAIANKLEALSGFLPHLQGSMSVTHGDDPVYVFGSLLHQEAFTSDDLALSRLNSPSPRTNVNFSVEGRVPIFDAFQTISKVRSGKLLIDSAKYGESFVRMEALLVATEAYLRAVSIEKLLATVTEMSQASEENIKQAQDLKEKGLILGADFFAAKVMFGHINQMKNELLQEKQAAHILLNILMGEDPLGPVDIQTDLGQSVKDQKALAAWFQEAYKARPDLAAVDKRIQAQGVDVSREKSSGLPRLDAFGEARQDSENLSSDGGRNYIIGLKAEVPLFDPSYGPRVRVSKESLKKLEYDKTLLKDQIAKDLSDEYARYQASMDNLPLFETMLEDARQAVDLMLPLYREGRKSIADLLEIRMSCLSVAREYYSLTAGSRASWTRLLFLSGQLDEARMDDVLKRASE